MSVWNARPSPAATAVARRRQPSNASTLTRSMPKSRSRSSTPVDVGLVGRLAAQHSLCPSRGVRKVAEGGAEIVRQAPPHLPIRDVVGSLFARTPTPRAYANCGRCERRARVALERAVARISPTSGCSSTPRRRSRPRWMVAMNLARLSPSVLRISSRRPAGSRARGCARSR
jgi:hypothetical protein